MHNQFWRQTAFDRPIDMYINNNTDLQFELVKTDLQSGMLEIYPPNSIPPGGSVHFKGDQTGLVGSSGFVTYKSKFSNSTVYISFYWSHPEGATASIYYGYSSPYGLFYVTPKNNYDPNQKPTNQNAVLKNWITNENEYENVLTLNPPGISQSVTYTIQYSLGHK
ncbi:hypothetical protein [Clostridium niameyense]|uniref:hypothetical protein n=1 Tax=Clostridium niameyense TaxID=1622073 RepID=UPI00067F3B30|nr:hypothetical protein [Clostridium niameyense]